MKRQIDEIVALEAAASRVSELIRSDELSTPVPHLGRWKVRDVAAHLGGVHRWATRIIVTRSQDGPSFTKSKLDGVDLCDWFDAGVEQLLEALRTNDPDGDCPNFNPGSANTVRWWSRRQMHETTIHRWDIEKALGCTTSIDGTLAADGIDEYLDVFVRTRGKQTLTAATELSSSDPAQSWTLTPAEKPGRIDVSPGGSVTPAAGISGPPDQLLLALWQRLTMAEAGLTIDGDTDVAASLWSSPS